MNKRKSQSNRIRKETKNRRKNQSAVRYPTENREFKDRLFKKVFEKKEYLLQLYNAVNGTDYQNPSELEVNTLEDVVYLGMKNDKSFLLGGMMNLYEHQSTYNPNLPIRGLLYFARLYEQYIEMSDISIYGSSRIELPVPQYIIFYNGTEETPEKSILKLSDAFLQKEVESALECTAVMLNINYGHNMKLLEKCQRLKEYSIFVASVRNYLLSETEPGTAVTKAVNECIEKNVLKDILVKNRAEVISMVLTSFNQDKYEKTLRNESYSKGYDEGGKQERILMKQVYGLKKQGCSAEKISQELHLSLEEVEDILDID